MNRDALDQWCERAIVGCVLGIVIFGPLAFGAVDTVPFLVIQGLTALGLLLWLGRFWLNPKLRLLWPPVFWAVLAFTGYAVIRYLTADIEYVARHELLRVLVYAAIFFLIVNNLHRQETTRVITFALIVLAVALSAYAGYQFLANSDRVWNVYSGYVHRGSGTYISPNHLGGFLEMILPLALAYSITGRVSAVARILIGYAALVIMVGIAVTVSRGAWIASGLSLVFFFGVLLFHRTHRIPALLCLLLLIAGGVYFAPKSHFLRVRSRVVQDGRVDDDTRFALWQPAVQLWRENIWWGVGPGHFDYRFRQVRPEQVQLQPYRVHNDFLNTLVDWGIIGAVLIAGPLVLIAWGAMRAWRAVRGTRLDLGENKRSNKFALVIGAATGLLAIFFHSVVDFNMHIPANAIIAVTLMALLSGLVRFATDNFWFTAGRASRAMATLVVGGGVFFLSQQTWRGEREHHWLAVADRQFDYSAEQATALERAFAADPENPDTAYQIGRALRRQSQEGGQQYQDNSGQNYQQRAEQAMRWFQRSLKLDPWNAAAALGYGWCLDWLGRTAESGPWFSKAEELDPNGYFTLDQIGLHYIECGEFAAARPWFERSLRLEAGDNLIAERYLQIANERLLQDATNELNLKLSSPGQ
jgi:O-antigen ligase